MNEVIERYGRIDACFPNAGVGTKNQKPFFEHSNEDWFDIIDVNLHGVFYTLRAATRPMIPMTSGPLGSWLRTTETTSSRSPSRTLG